MEYLSPLPLPCDVYSHTQNTFSRETQKMNDRRLNRRQMLRLAAATPAIATLAACVLPPPPLEDASTASEPPPPAAENLTLSHWQPFGSGHRAAIETLREQFEEQNSGLSIDIQPIGWSAYWDYLSASSAGGDPPDSYRIPMGLAENHIAAGRILPVSELILSNADIEEAYLPWTVQRAKKDNSYYGLPVDVQTLVVYRNNTLYAEAGLDPAAPFSDLEDLLSQAQALTTHANDKISQIGCNTGGYPSAWLTILFQQYLQREEDGAPWIDPTSNQLVWQDYPAIFEIFDWFCTLTAQADDDDFLSFLSSEEQFVVDKSAMQIGHPVHRNIFENLVSDVNYTIVPFPPRAPGHEPYTAGSHWLWVVSQSAADYAETAWKWVAFGTNKEAQTIWHEKAGDLPSLKELTTDARFRPDDNAAVCIDSLNNSSPWEWVGWVEWVTEFNSARTKVVNDAEDRQKAFADLIANLNETIAQYTA